MKRLKYFIIALIFVFTPIVKADLLDYQTCYAFAQGARTITGTYDYRYCYRAACSTTGKFNLANMIGTSGYRCSNQNGDPWTEWKNDECARYTGSCDTKDVYYCRRTKTVDCNRKSDGSAYNSPTTPSSNVGSPNTSSRVVTAATTTANRTTRRTGSGTTKVVIPVTTAEKTTESTRPVVTTDTTKPPLSNNLNINKITINGTDIKYRNGYDEYTIKLPYGIRDLDVVVETEDEKTVTYIEGAYDMPDEDTQILIEAMAEDGSTKDIIINVSRYTGESNDCNIANIVVNDYDLRFDKNNYTYNLRIGRKTKSLDMEIIPSDPLHATVEVLNNS